MLECKQIHLALDEFELSADFGLQRHTAVIGASGSGKSTLLSLLGGYTPLKSGAVMFDGESVTERAPFERPFAALFQDHNLFPHLSALENVALGCDANLKLDTAQQDAVHDALDAVGMKGLEARKPAALSGGQQARVALARVMVQGKALLLLDEPFAALGPKMRADMIALTKDVAAQNGASIMMVTHNMQDVDHLAGDVIWVENGSVAAPQPWDAFKAAPPQGFSEYTGT